MTVADFLVTFVASGGSIVIGQTISHYRISQKIGGGGMGVVYKAQDLKLDRTVALKFLPMELTYDPIAKERFIHEAKAASSLDHPNICTIFEIAEAESGQLFISMLYCEGINLKSRIERGPVDLSQAVNIMYQVAEGLKEAHRHDIIHRDIKPANIMITPDDKAKIVDFGLAKLLHGSTITQVGSTLGTIAYMSPEQLRGEDVDKRTDIWSWGVMFFEILAGQRPFKGDHPLTISYSIVNEAPESLSRYLKDVPKEIESLIQSCLQKDRNLRPQSMDEVVRALEGKFHKQMFNRYIRPVLFSKRIMASLVILVVVIISVFYFLIYNRQVPSHNDSEWRIAVKEFIPPLKDSTVSEWPSIIQSILVRGLSGVKGVKVIDIPSTSLSSSVTLDYNNAKILVQGQVVKSGGGYSIQPKIVNLANSNILHPCNPRSLKKEEELDKVVPEIVREILNIVEIKSMKEDIDLEPWYSQGTDSISAIKAFCDASRFIYHSKTGGREYLYTALSIDSNFISPRIWLIASLAHFPERVEEAKYHYQILSKLKPRANLFQRTMIDWCDAYLKMDYLIQIHALRRARDQAPKNNIILYTLGETLYNLKDYRAALDAFTPVVERNWDYDQLYPLVAKCYLKQGKHKQARELLERALTITDPAAGDTYGLLAALNLRSGDTLEADAYLSKAMQSYSGSPFASAEIQTNLGIDFLEAGCWTEALGYFNHILKQNPGWAIIHEYSADALSGAGDWEGALKEYNAAIGLDSTLVSAHFKIGEISDKKGKVDDALYHYREFLVRDSISQDAVKAKRREQYLSSKLLPN